MLAPGPSIQCRVGGAWSSAAAAPPPGTGARQQHSCLPPALRPSRGGGHEHPTTPTPGSGPRSPLLAAREASPRRESAAAAGWDTGLPSRASCGSGAPPPPLPKTLAHPQLSCTGEHKPWYGFYLKGSQADQPVLGTSIDPEQRMAKGVRSFARAQHPRHRLSLPPRPPPVMEQLKMSCQKLGRTSRSLCNNSSVLVSPACAGRGRRGLQRTSAAPPGAASRRGGLPEAPQTPIRGVSALAAGRRGAGRGVDGVGGRGVHPARGQAGGFALLPALEAIAAAAAAPVPEERAAAGLVTLEEPLGREGVAGSWVPRIQTGSCKAGGTAPLRQGQSTRRGCVPGNAPQEPAGA